MLDTVTQLAQDVGRDVRGALRDEINAHALGTDEADYLLNLVREGLGGAFEEHVRLVKEEHQLGKVHIAHFRQGGVKLAEQPQQEGGIQLGLEHELVRRQHILVLTQYGHPSPEPVKCVPVHPYPVCGHVPVRIAAG